MNLLAMMMSLGFYHSEDVCVGNASKTFTGHSQSYALIKLAF